MSKRSIDFSLCRLLASNVQRAFDVVRAGFFDRKRRKQFLYIYLDKYITFWFVVQRALSSHHSNASVRLVECRWSNASRCSHFIFLFVHWLPVPFTSSNHIFKQFWSIFSFHYDCFRWMRADDSGLRKRKVYQILVFGS